MDSGPFSGRRALPGLCRFLDAGNEEAPQAQLTGVQKAPRHEVAGSWALAGRRALWGFMLAPISMIEVMPAGFDLRVCTDRRSAGSHRHFGGCSERIDAGSAQLIVNRSGVPTPIGELAKLLIY